MRIVRRGITLAGFVGVALVVWFLVVDRSWFVERCPTCGMSRHRLQDRICGVVVRETESADPSMIQRVSADLGVPCPHSGLKRWHQHRWWGLLICSCPCENGTLGLTGDSTWYTPSVAAKLQHIAATAPERAEEFRQRVLVERDYAYWQAFVAEVSDDTTP